MRHYIWDEWIQLGHVYHNENIGGRGHGKKIIQLYFQALSSPLFLSCSSFLFFFIIIIINKLTQDTKTENFLKAFKLQYGTLIFIIIIIFFFGEKIWYTLKKALLSLINISWWVCNIMNGLNYSRSCQYQ